MLITGNPTLPGTGRPATIPGTGSSGNISTVKTDGTTITGDGNTTPLALGPGEKYSVGCYIVAEYRDRTLDDRYGSYIPGEKLTASRFVPVYAAGRTDIYLPGTYRLCSQDGISASSQCLVQRVA